MSRSMRAASIAAPAAAEASEAPENGCRHRYRRLFRHRFFMPLFSRPAAPPRVTAAPSSQPWRRVSRIAVCYFDR